MLLPRYLVQSYEKSRAERKKLVSFLCRDGVTYLKLRKIESRTKETRFFFMPRWSNLNMPLFLRVCIGKLQCFFHARGDIRQKSLQALSLSYATKREIHAGGKSIGNEAQLDRQTPQPIWQQGT